MNTRNRFLSALLVLIFILSINSYSHAKLFFGADPSGKPSIFHYGFSGFFTGMLLGLSIGYIMKTKTDDSKEMGKGVAYGAIGGSVVGLGIGFYDVKNPDRAIGGVFMRDIALGGILGILVGGAAGTAKYLDTDDWEDFGKYVAWGNIIGAGCGAIVAFIEGPAVIEEEEFYPKGPSEFMLTWKKDDMDKAIPYVVYRRRF